MVIELATKQLKNHHSYLSVLGIGAWQVIKQMYILYIIEYTFFIACQAPIDGLS